MGSVRRKVAAFAAAAAVVGGVAIAVPLVSEAAGNKSHDLKAATSAGTASTVEPGAASATVVITVKNTSTSGNITANGVRIYPTNWGTAATITNVTKDPAGTMTPFATTLAAPIPYIEVADTNIRRNGEFKLTLTVQVSCAATTGQLLTFTSDVRQSNDFNPNNVSNQLPYMEDDGALPRTTVGNPCKLSFTGQPSNARPGETITQTQFNPAGSAVQVTVKTNSDVTVAWESRNVTVAATLLPSTAKTLGGTATVATTAGVANFTNLTLADEGTYNLTATATKYAGSSTASSNFIIFDANCFVEVVAEPCAITVVEGANDASIVVNESNTLIAKLTADFAAGVLNCPGYEEFGDELTFDIDVFGDTDLTGLSKDLVVTKPVPATWVAAHGSDPWDFQVCFKSPYAFRALIPWVNSADQNYDSMLQVLSGGPLLQNATAVTGGYQGLLPRCSVLAIDSPSDDNGPCIQSVVYNPTTGKVTITAKVHADDPTWK